MPEARRTHLQPRNLDLGFFDDRGTQTAIKDLATADRLTLFVGAGASIDQSLPSWSTLVSSLLGLADPSIAGSKSNMSHTGNGRITQLVVDNLHQMPTASVVDQLYFQKHRRGWKAKRNEDLRALLYPGTAANEINSIGSPSLAEYIVKLAIASKIRGADVHIVTTNYDDLIERVCVENAEILALLDDSHLKVTSHAGGAVSPHPRAIPIVHVHGYLPREGKAKDIIFSEADYVDWEQVSAFKDYLLPRFANGRTLFIGSSLRDNNIAALLKRSNNGGQRRCFALIPLEEDINSGLPLEVAQYPFLRGKHLGIEVLRPDFYGQVYQFLYEVSLCAAAVNPRDILPYSKRLRRWWHDWENLAQGSPERLSPTGMTGELQALAQLAASEVAEADFAKAEMWLRVDPDQRVLELWSSSQSVRTEGTHYWPHRVKFGHGSRNSAVRSFAARTAIQSLVDYRTDGRWTHYLSVPILLSEPPYYEIPAGVVTLLFHAPKLNSQPRLTSVEEKRATLVDIISEMGYSLLSPDVAARQALTK